MINENYSLRTGSAQVARGDDYGGQLVADSAARYYNMVKRGNVFFAANSGTATISLAGTAMTGLTVHNPAGSGKNIVLLEVCIAIGAIPAAASLLVLGQAAVPASTAVTHTSALSIYNALVTGAASSTSVAKADASSTTPSLVVCRVFGGGTPAASNTITMPPFIKDEVAGALVFAPGTVFGIATITTALLTSMVSFTWAEEPI